MENQEEKTPFYKRSWFIILALVFFFPIGLYLMWAHTNWNKSAKWIVTAIIALIGISSLATGDDTTTSTASQEPATEVAKADENATSKEDLTADKDETEVTEPEVTENEEVETDSGEQEESATEDEEVVEEEQAEEVVGIGEVLDVDGLEFTVNDWYQQDSVGNVLSSTANDTYIVMNLSVVNNKNEAITVDSTFFKIVDGERVFEPDSTASMYANDDSIGLFLESINPGSSRTANIVFDVTQDVVDSQDKQLQAQSGFWGTETGIINLQ